MKNKTQIYRVMFVIFMQLVLFTLLFKGVINESRVYDEVTYVKVGYGFLTKHDFRLDPFNPPFARELVALPMLINSEVYKDPRLIAPRMVVIVVTLLFSLLIYLFTKKLFGTAAAFLSLTLFTIDPNILAHGHYATMDMIFSFLFVLTLYLYFIWKKKFSYKKIIFFSIILGLTLSSKISALFFLFPSLIIVYFFDNPKWKTITFWKEKKNSILLLIFITLLTLWSTYFFTFEPLLGYRFDPERPAIKLAETNYLVKIALTQPMPLGSYISTIKQQILYNYSGWYRKDSFIMGDLSGLGHPGYYFPLIILIKTPITIILFFLTSAFYFIKKRKKHLVVLIPITFVLASIMFTKVTLVLRYILPLYILIMMYSSQVININTKKTVIKYGILAGLLLWHIYGLFKVTPHYVSFTNQFFDGYKNGYKYVFDANYDWGQGLVVLKNYQDKNNISDLQLAYFGDLDPKILGLKYMRIKDASLSDTQKTYDLKLTKNSTIAISATCWYLCGYYKDTRIKDIESYDIVGGSILIFRID
ncbi:MAG: glycosyltransferase family 39 protein [Candidatus Levybacteria bacterium]|nr:glycosyltransferase family 39 protein [Candidatus Levybacteria bacterium]